MKLTSETEVNKYQLFRNEVHFDQYFTIWKLSGYQIRAAQFSIETMTQLIPFSEFILEPTLFDKLFVIILQDILPFKLVQMFEE